MRDGGVSVTNRPSGRTPVILDDRGWGKGPGFPTLRLNGGFSFSPFFLSLFSRFHLPIPQSQVSRSDFLLWPPHYYLIRSLGRNQVKGLMSRVLVVDPKASF